MEPIIYNFPRIDKIREISESDIYFDQNSSPKLIKYGFNSIDQQLDMTALTSNKYYKTGLEFDFDREDDNSFRTKVAIKLDTDIDIDITFAEFWEILNVFFFNTISTGHIYTSHPDTINNINSIKGNPDKYKVSSMDKNKVKNNDVDLVIYKYSDIDLDENAYVSLIIDALPKLLQIQKKSASMVLQLFNIQTQISVEIIYYLCSIYTESYLIKPTVDTELSDNKYLVLMGLKENGTFFNFKIKSAPDIYLILIGIKNIPENFIMIIQCMISFLVPKKFRRYYLIKSYLDSKVYEGMTYQDLINTQNKNTDTWIDTYLNLDNVKMLLDKAIKMTDIKCPDYKQLIELFS